MIAYELVHYPRGHDCPYHFEEVYGYTGGLSASGFSLYFGPKRAREVVSSADSGVLCKILLPHQNLRVRVRVILAYAFRLRDTERSEMPRR